MRKETPAKKKTPSPADEADPRFIPVAAALARTRGFSLMESKSRATRGLMLDGKSFGMSMNGRFILKMNEERARELVAAGIGEPFVTGGRAMKGWIEVTSAKADWAALTKEALRIARGGKAAPATKETKKGNARAKTQKAFSTIDGYLAGVTGEKRVALEKLRKTIRTIVPQAEECISYRIPAFRVDGRIVAGFCARATGCSYFPFSGRTLKTLAKDLAGYGQTKSALHFSPEKGLPAGLLRRLIEARMGEGK